MSIVKYIASADSTITNAFKPNTTTRAFYANLGAADSLEIFSIAHSGSTPEKSRVLVRFPIDKIIENRSTGKIPEAGSVNYILKMYNVQHPETLPKKYQVLIKPISGSWDEGNGLDLETYSDVGQNNAEGYGVNWKFRSTTEIPYHWYTDGGDYWSGYDKTFYFENGTEDLEVDITDIVEAQIDGIISSDGVAIMLSGSFEDSTEGLNFYTKRFSSRSSEYYYKLPSLEARWEATIKDDRGNFSFASPNLSDEDNKQNIYFYNKVRGQLKDLPGSVIPNIKILNESGVELTSSIQSTKVSTGIYRANFSITGSSECQLVDVWYSGSVEYFRSQIEAAPRLFEDTYVDSEYVFAMTNLKNSYKNYEFPSIRVFGRHKNWSPNIYKTATNTIDVFTLDNLYYKAFRIVDNFTVIDYGIDPIPYTKCSYDKNGNYFDLDMSFFEPGYAYGIKLMTLNGDLRTEYPKVFRFKVE